MNDYKTYSEAKKRLEEIARELEESDITLEKSMELYEEGTRTAAVCYEMLSNAKMKFTQLSENAKVTENEE